MAGFRSVVAVGHQLWTAEFPEADDATAFRSAFDRIAANEGREQAEGYVEDLIDRYGGHVVAQIATGKGVRLGGAALGKEVKQKMPNEIKVNRLHVLSGRDDNLLAICDLRLSGDFVVEGARVIQGENGPFVALPSRQATDGKYKEVVHPVTREARDALNATVLQAYEKERAAAQEAAVER